MKTLLIAISVLFFTACSSLKTTEFNGVEYITLSSDSNFYYIEGEPVNKKNRQALYEKLERTGIKRLLMEDFTFGDLINVGSALSKKGYKMYYLTKQNELREINAM